MEHKGFEPSTSSMPWRRAPNCANAPCKQWNYNRFLPMTQELFFSHCQTIFQPLSIFSISTILRSMRKSSLFRKKGMPDTIRPYDALYPALSAHQGKQHPIHCRQEDKHHQCINWPHDQISKCPHRKDFSQCASIQNGQ